MSATEHDAQPLRFDNWVHTQIARDEDNDRLDKRRQSNARTSEGMRFHWSVLGLYRAELCSDLRPNTPPPLRNRRNRG